VYKYNSPSTIVTYHVALIHNLTLKNLYDKCKFDFRGGAQSLYFNSSRIKADWRIFPKFATYLVHFGKDLVASLHVKRGNCGARQPPQLSFNHKATPPFISSTDHSLDSKSSTRLVGQEKLQSKGSGSCKGNS
jgi:hypothetical protein